MQTEIQSILNLLEKNQLEKAHAECLALSQNQPKAAEVQDLLGLIYAKQGKLNSALEQFKLALSLEPSQVIFHNHISNTYKLLGDLDLATRYLNEALRYAPNNAETYNNLGSLYYTQGQIDQAIPCFEKAIRLNPNSWEAHYNLANCFIRGELVYQAIDQYLSAINLNPKHSNAKVNLAMAYVSIKDYTSALPWLIEAANNNPEHAELQGHLAEAYLDLGKASEAIEQFNRALALEPDRAEWQHNLAVLYLRNKQSELAREHFAKSLKLNPDNHTAKHMLMALDSDKHKTADIAPAEYVSDLFDQYASYYNQHVKNNLKYNVPYLLRNAISKVLTLDIKQQNVLDLGCGTGLCGVYFRDLAGYMIGVDLSAAMLAQAKALDAYEGLCRCDILQAIPGQNLYMFDIVLAADVFVYIGDLAKIFNNIESAIRATGKISFTIENLDGNQDFKLQTTGRFSHNPNYIQRLCEEVNWQIIIKDQITLREQDGIPIIGWLFVASRNK